MFKYLSITKDVERAQKFFENFLAYTTSPYALHELIKKDVNSFSLIDVRDYEDYIDGHIPFAEHMPFEDLASHLEMVEKDKPTIIYTYDFTCNRAKKASLIFIENMYPAIELIGGFKAWKKHGYDIVKTDAIEG